MDYKIIFIIWFLINQFFPNTAIANYQPLLQSHNVKKKILSSDLANQMNHPIFNSISSLKPTIDLFHRHSQNSKNYRVSIAPRVYINHPMPKKKLPVKEILKFEGGFTIAHIYSNKLDFAGKVIRVRGKVTSFNPAIMNTNWLHIMDASTSRELIITSNNVAKVGDVVIVIGNITLNKDLGYGYKYEVLMENARVFVE